jgi:hypothetical protein
MTIEGQQSLFPDRTPEDINQAAADHISAHAHPDPYIEQDNRMLRYADLPTRPSPYAEGAQSPEGPKLEDPRDQAEMDAQLRRGRVATGAAFQAEHRKNSRDQLLDSEK